MRYERLLNKKATSGEREFTAKALRFAVTGSQEDFRAVADAIDGAFKGAIEVGQTKLRLAVTDDYDRRAGYYYSIYRRTEEHREAREALDTLLRAVLYDANEWLYWSTVSWLLTETWQDKAVYDLSKAERYGKIAVAMNPRDPFAYCGLLHSLYLAGAVTVGTAFQGGAWFVAQAVAARAVLGAADFHLFFAAEGSLLESEG